MEGYSPYIQIVYTTIGQVDINTVFLLASQALVFYAFLLCCRLVIHNLWRVGVIGLTLFAAYQLHRRGFGGESQTLSELVSELGGGLWKLYHRH
jgi:hypothetical protein